MAGGEGNWRNGQAAAKPAKTTPNAKRMREVGTS
jgi:hypothetical protein